MSTAIALCLFFVTDKMTKRSFEALTPKDLAYVEKFEPYYDCIPGGFGLPPRIPRDKKLQLGMFLETLYFPRIDIYFHIISFERLCYNLLN